MSRSQRTRTDPIPVVIVGAGPVGLTAATLLGQYGVDCLVLDRWEGVYPQPRAVHLDDEIYRILARLGIAEQFAAVSRPTRGLQLIDRNHRVFRLELVRVAEYTFRAQLADHWRDRNVFLMGDAAHLTPPFVGQGMGAGLRDAMNLSWKIAGVLSGDLPEAVLDTYQAERKPHARAMIRLAKLVGVSMTQGGRTGDLLRKLIAPRAHWVPGLRQRLLDGETPRLSRSTLNHRPPARRTLAGSLCPNALLADGRRLDDLTANGFLLVTAAPLTPHQQALLEARGAQPIEVVAGTQLHAWLSKGRATAALVRPDMTVMQAGRDVAALCEAVPRFQIA